MEIVLKIEASEKLYYWQWKYFQCGKIIALQKFTHQCVVQCSRNTIRTLGKVIFLVVEIFAGRTESTFLQEGSME